MYSPTFEVLGREVSRPGVPGFSCSFCSGFAIHFAELLAGMTGGPENGNQESGKKPVQEVYQTMTRKNKSIERQN